MQNLLPYGLYVLQLYQLETTGKAWQVNSTNLSE